MKIRFAKPGLLAESCSPAAMQQVHGSGVKSNDETVIIFLPFMSKTVSFSKVFNFYV